MTVRTIRQLWEIVKISQIFINFNEFSSFQFFYMTLVPFFMTVWTLILVYALTKTDWKQMVIIS